VKSPHPPAALLPRDAVAFLRSTLPLVEYATGAGYRVDLHTRPAENSITLRGPGVAPVVTLCLESLTDPRPYPTGATIDDYRAWLAGEVTP
jgi:hypothetical protein